MLGCDNILYSLFGHYSYMLVASDASTGEWIWQRSDEVLFFTPVISNDCKYVTYLRDPNDNLNYTLVRLDSKTGTPVWETTLNVKRNSDWDWFAYESDVANRIVVIGYFYNEPSFYFSGYFLQFYAANSGKKTFEKYFPGSSQSVVFFEPIVFSKDGSLAIFSPLESICISIAGNEDVLLWSVGGKEGAASAPYFSNSSKTALTALWNYGNNKFIALNTKDGSTLWESSWQQLVVSEFFEFGDDVLALTGKDLYKIDTVKCPLP